MNQAMNHFIAPILIATEVKNVNPIVALTPQNDKLFIPVKTSAAMLASYQGSINFFRRIGH